jgi:hypothetical protein
MPLAEAQRHTGRILDAQVKYEPPEADDFENLLASFFQSAMPD